MITIIPPPVTTGLLIGFCLLLTLAIIATLYAYLTETWCLGAFPIVMVWLATIVMFSIIISIPCTNYQMIAYGEQPSAETCKRLIELGY